jgi:hypothetical protein
LSPSAFHCATVGAEEVLRQNAINNRKFWDNTALIGPTDPPVNILGEHRWSILRRSK